MRLLDLFSCQGGAAAGYMDVVKALLGVDHDMTWEGLFECIPPAYTENIGHQLVAAIRAEAAA